MSGMAVDGLVSGLQTSTIIAKLMKAESGQRNLLDSKSKRIQSQITALQSLNTKSMSLNAAAKKLAHATDTWGAVTGTSTDKTVSVSGKAGTTPASLTFTVDKLAQGEVALLDFDTLKAKITSAGAPFPPSITISSGGKLTTVYPSKGETAADLSQAIAQAKEAGVNATAVRGMDGKYTLQITANATGAENGSVEIFIGKTAAEVAAAVGIEESQYGTDADGKVRTVTMTDEQKAAWNTLKGSMTSLKSADYGFGQARAAQDAEITLWAGTASEQRATSATNTFDKLVDGVSVTVGGDATDAAGKPLPKTGMEVTIDLKPDSSKAVEAMKGMVANINLVLAEISSRTSSTTEKAADGRDILKPGLLGGDSNVRSLRQSVMDGVFAPVNGESPSVVGLKTKGGVAGSTAVSVEFDQAAFEKLLKEDPAKAQEMATALAQRFEKISDNFSGREGLITNAINARQGDVRDIRMRLDSWDARLALREKGLKRQFDQMEKTLGKMRKQSEWLTGQIASLPSMGKR